MLANVDSLLETARADEVVGKDVSNQGNTKNRIRLLHSVETCPARSRPGVQKKVPGGNRAFLELNGEFEIVLR